jgi:osmotically-inducible protein OsmY
MTRTRLIAPLIGGLAGAAATFFLDPQSGHRRRTETVARSAAMARRAARVVGHTGRGAVAEMEGKTRGAVHAVTGSPRAVDDPTLADRVRSELFRDDAVPKGSININAEREGVVVLRGQVQNLDTVKNLERRVRRIPDVRDVENLLHTPGTAAKMHT